MEILGTNTIGKMRSRKSFFDSHFALLHAHQIYRLHQKAKSFKELKNQNN